jgi:hypothetical protein
VSSEGAPPATRGVLAVRATDATLSLMDSSSLVETYRLRSYSVLRLVTDSSCALTGGGRYASFCFTDGSESLARFV